jgi:hypothetical protein
LIRFKQPCEFVPSRSLKANTEVTGGGYVKEPKRGFYRVPLASLDFASLYPSIMIAFNICFSTKVELSWARANLKEGDYWIPYPAIDKKTPEMLAEEKEQADLERAAGIKRKKKNKKDREREALEAQYAGVEPSFCFVKRHIRQGVLPLLLETLLEARRNVKNMMKSDQAKADKLYYSVLDGRQLALKVVCNSVYGFLKAFILTDKDLMSAVTSYGRNMIYKVTIKFVFVEISPAAAGGGGINPFNFFKVNDVIKQEFSNNDVVDCPACRKLGIDPEIEPKAGEVDMRPRTRTKAFAVYGGKQKQTKAQAFVSIFCYYFVLWRLKKQNAYAFCFIRHRFRHGQFRRRHSRRLRSSRRACRQALHRPDGKAQFSRF